MRVKLTTLDVTEVMRRGIAIYFGDDGKADRDTVARYLEAQVAAALERAENLVDRDDGEY